MKNGASEWLNERMRGTGNALNSEPGFGCRCRQSKWLVLLRLCL